MPPRHDEAFQKPARLKWLPNKRRPVKEIAAELGICTDTLKSWLKRVPAFAPASAAHQNREDKLRRRELEAELRLLLQAT